MIGITTPLAEVAGCGPSADPEFVIEQKREQVLTAEEMADQVVWQGKAKGAGAEMISLKDATNTSIYASEAGSKVVKYVFSSATDRYIGYGPKMENNIFRKIVDQPKYYYPAGFLSPKRVKRIALYAF